VIALANGEAAGFNWIQEGKEGGYPTYYGRIFEDEARFLRAGVLPAWRRKGVNRRMKTLLLQRYFQRGVRRVWVESYRNNLPSIQSLKSQGFRPVGEISVIEIPGFRNYIKWHSLTDPDG
jgi:ribosomal protein S18 acetylase RimI-like enzyme